MPVFIHWLLTSLRCRRRFAIQLTEGADAADVAALLFVRERLTACCVNGPAAIYLMATSILISVPWGWWCSATIFPS